MKLLYIGEEIVRITSGADQVNKRNQKLLKEIFNEQISFVTPINGGLWNNLLMDVNKRTIDAVKNELNTGGYTHVFIAQSLMGRIAKVIKRNYPSIEIIIFFHNIEAQYAQEYYKTSGLKALPFYIFAKWWEWIGCKYSDKFITLNNRDSHLLKQIYGKEATIELPTSFDDIFDSEKANAIVPKDNTIPVDYLFVGVAFFANIQGVQWFIDNVMPKVEGHFHIVGKGMDKVVFKNITPNIHVYGFVDDLSDFYYRAKMVVSPIFVGGGMKTKTAEALMYGKTILGTQEAFEGYEIDNRSMFLCVSINDFVETISKLKGGKTINPFSREVYIRYYSTQAALKSLNNIFNEYTK